MEEKKAHILLAEDDMTLSFVTRDNLEREGFRVSSCADGESAWEAFRNDGFDICILDVMLPKLDGFSLAERIRAANKSIPIIFLTARSMKEDKIAGFKLGADDYITKPFSIEELVLRIEVFLRRSVASPKEQQSPASLQLGSYTFHPANLLLVHEGKKTKLTQKEAELLKLFCTHKDQLLKREEILKTLWGDDDYFNGRSLDVFISRLRKYLSQDKCIRIENIHAVGFRMEIAKNC